VSVGIASTRQNASFSVSVWVWHFARIEKIMGNDSSIEEITAEVVKLPETFKASSEVETPPSL
jgi:hypothetical protein